MGPVENLIQIEAWRRNSIVKWGVAGFEGDLVVNVCLLMLWWRINGTRITGLYHEVAVKNIVYGVQLPFVSVIDCSSWPGGNAAVKEIEKGRWFSLKIYGWTRTVKWTIRWTMEEAGQTIPEIQFGGYRGEGIKVETIRGGEERIQHFIVWEMSSLLPCAGWD